MEPFRIHSGLVAPMDRENVDTDAIIPKQFLKSIKRSGFGPNLFDAWRYLDPGEPGQDPAIAPAESRFRPQPAALPGRVDPARAQELRLRLVARARAVGAAAVRLSRADRAELRRHLLQQLLQERRAADRAAGAPGRQAVRRGRRVRRLPPDHRPRAPGRRSLPGGDEIGFEVEPFRKYCLLGGYDDVALTLRHADKIRAFEAERLLKQPWLATTIR